MLPPDGDFVYSTEPLRSAYEYTGLGSMVSVFMIAIIIALFVALALGGLLDGRNKLGARLLVLVAFCAFPMYWVYQSQNTNPPPNIPVIGVVDSHSESQEMVRVSKLHTEPRWRGYVLYRVEDVLYPVQILPGRPLPERAIFYKNPQGR